MGVRKEEQLKLIWVLSLGDQGMVVILGDTGKLGEEIKISSGGGSRDRDLCICLGYFIRL